MVAAIKPEPSIAHVGGSCVVVCVPSNWTDADAWAWVADKLAFSGGAVWRFVARNPCCARIGMDHVTISPGQGRKCALK